MGGSDEITSSTTPSKPSASPNASNSDVNGRNYLPSKPKESEEVAKKKVSTERNEDSDSLSCENLGPEIPNLDPKPSSVKLGSALSCRASDFSGNEGNSLAAELSSQPYDPFTNYLPPRPKFLCYKPNRRREIFVRQGNDRQEEGNCDENALSVFSAPSFEEEDTGLDNLGESDCELNEIDGELGKEDEEDRFWTVKNLLKLLLITVSLVLCTSYITSMNTSFEVSEAFRSEFCPILNHTGDSSVKNLKGGNKFDQQEERKIMEEGEIMDGEYEGEDAYENTEHVREAAGNPRAEKSYPEEMAEDENFEVEFLEQTVEDDGDQEKGTKCEIFDMMAAAPSEIPEENGSIETPMPVQFDQENLVSDILTASGNEHEPLIAVVEDGDRKIVDGNTEDRQNFMYDASKMTKWEMINSGISSLFGITYLEELEKLQSELIEFLNTESLLKVIVGLSAASAILTSLFFSLQLKKKSDDEREPAVSPSVIPLIETLPFEAEEIITRESPWIKPDFDRSSSEHIENFDSFTTPPFLIHSKGEVENFKDFHDQKAPTVEFLGEFMVGEISSSVKKKRIGLKNRIIEAKGSSFSVSVEEKPVSKMRSEPDTTEQALSDFSTMNSPSFGSFTTEKKILKQEVGEMKLITTPVRRSTRIRNRMVSP